jgi:hypothetical protein
MAVTNAASGRWRTRYALQLAPNEPTFLARARHISANWAVIAKFGGEYGSGFQTYGDTGTLRCDAGQVENLPRARRRPSKHDRAPGGHCGRDPRRGERRFALADKRWNRGCLGNRARPRGNGAAETIFLRHFYIDNGHCFRYIAANLAHEGRRREVDLTAGASAVPAGGVTNRSRAALGISRR